MKNHNPQSMIIQFNVT